MFGFLASLLRKSSYAFPPPIKTHGQNWLILRVAGLAFEGRSERLRLYRLGEFLQLRHEANNTHDTSALAVEDRKGFVVGYIDRKIAPRLLDALPALKTGVPAEITQLKRDADGKSAGLKICLGIEKEVLERIHTRFQLDYFLERSPKEGMWLLLECTDTTYFRVLRRMKARNFEIMHSGLSYKLAGNGRLYDRYLKLGAPHSEEDIHTFFLEEFGIRPREEEAMDLLLEMEAEMDAEQEVFTSSVEELEKKVIQLTKELEKLRPLARSNQRLRKIEARLREDYPNILQALLPHLRFQRDSMKCLLEELLDPLDALSKLNRLNENLQISDGKRVRGAKEWWELRFRTGQAENGRLYYRPLDDSTEVLLSIKQRQAKDMEYLRKHG